MLNLDKTILKEEFQKSTYPWEVLKDLDHTIENVGKLLSDVEFDLLKDENNNNLWIHKTSKVSKLSTILGPTIIDEGAEIRPGAFIRGKVIIGKNAVVGNSSELKNTILFDEAKAPHFNYVGNSILGHKVNLGAGVKLSNMKNDRSNITVLFQNKKINTKLRKLGAIIGDYSAVGCNTVTNPGVIIGKNVDVYPMLSLRGTYKDNSIIKSSTSEIIVSKKI